MNFNLVYQMIKNNGGASYNPFTGRYNPITGYMVSREKYEARFPEPKNPETFAIDVQNYVTFTKLPTDLYEDENTYFGFWIHEGELYIDISDNILDFDQAYNTAFERNQLAIYDCVKHRDITIVHDPKH